MRRLSALILCFALLLSGCGQTDSPVSTAAPAAAATQQPAPTPTPQPTVDFSATGDNLIHGQLYLQAQRRACLLYTSRCV